MEDIIDFGELGEQHFIYAGFPIRFAAFMIDVVILAVAQGILAYSINGSFFFYNFWIPAAISFFYFGGLESSTMQATPGMRLLGIYVAGANGERITFVNAAGRYFGKLLSGTILFIGFFMIIWDAKHQALHDKLAHTFVIQR